LKRSEAAFAVHISARVVAGQRVRKVDSASTTLYVRARSRMARTPDSVQVLIKYGPWTAETIPFFPPARDARVIAKRVTRLVASRVSRDRRKDRPFWSSEMEHAGKKEVRKDPKSRTARRAKARPDVTHPAVGLEFGIGRRAQPHWRPALLPFTRSPGRAILRAAPTLSDLLDPKFRRWKTWGTKVRSTISLSETQKLQPFQTKILGL
jgi:hypothetical protein